MIRIAEPRIGDREREAVLQVLASGRLTGGPYTQRLEAEFARRVSATAEAIAVSSGTAALHLALLAHGIGPGDEVITSPFSFQATANMVLATGARPVFVDVGPDGNLDPALVEAALTPRTKALLPVHLFGRLCDMPALSDIAARHHLALIEDAAQAHGAALTESSSIPAPASPIHGSSTPAFSLEGECRDEGELQSSPSNSSALSAGREAGGEDSSPSPRKERGPGGEDAPPAVASGPGLPRTDREQGSKVQPAGSFGTGCFSLYATKNLTAGEGGVITTNDPDLAQRLRRLRSHGEADRYESIEVGYNYRITEIGAALALAQLDALEEGNQRRRQNAAYLSHHLQGVELPPQPAEPASHVWHQYTIRVPALGGEGTGESSARDTLQSHLRDRGIEAMVYYPRTLPAQKLYRDLGYDDAALPVARRLASEVLSLPVHPGLTPADLQAIVSAVNEWTSQHITGKATSK